MRRLTGLRTGRATLAALCAAVITGCAGQPSCQRPGPQAWFSGWGSNSGNAFTAGLRREWDPCPPAATSRPPAPFAPPSADPASETTAGPLPPPR